VQGSEHVQGDRRVPAGQLSVRSAVRFVVFDSPTYQAR
jgi:hypothetical protein